MAGTDALADFNAEEIARAHLGADLIRLRGSIPQPQFSLLDDPFANGRCRAKEGR
jgi:hypothetical protein